MKTTVIEVGTACNNRCVFCARANKKGNRTTEEIRALILEAKSSGAEALSFSGGEPTARKDFVDLFNFACRQGFERIVIETNARRLGDPDFAGHFIRLGVHFSVSFHGPDAAVHEQNTQVPGSFGETVRAVRFLLSKGMSLSTNTVVSRFNLPFLPRIVSVLAELGVPAFYISFPSITGGALNRFEEIVPRFSELHPHLEKAIENVGGSRILDYRFQGIPLCHLAGLEEHSYETADPGVSNYTIEGEVGSIFENIRDLENVKREACHTCRWDFRCIGVDREYVRRRGWEEFNPVEP